MAKKAKVESLIVKKTIMEYIKSKGVSTTPGFIDGINDYIAELLNNAINKAKADGTNILDIVNIKGGGGEPAGLRG